MILCCALECLAFSACPYKSLSSNQSGVLHFEEALWSPFGCQLIVLLLPY